MTIAYLCWPSSRRASSALDARVTAYSVRNTRSRKSSMSGSSSTMSRRGFGADTPLSMESRPDRAQPPQAAGNVGRGELQDRGDAGEARIGDQARERRAPDVPLTDGGMAVDTRPALAPRVVEVKRLHPEIGR